MNNEVLHLKNDMKAGVKRGGVGPVKAEQKHKKSIMILWGVLYHPFQNWNVRSKEKKQIKTTCGVAVLNIRVLFTVKIEKKVYFALLIS